MGTAIIVPGVSFSNPMGRVTLFGDKTPNALHIISESSYTAYEVQLAVRYEPANTALREVIWSITSGGDYATIDNSGKLTINSNASSSSVEVHVVSASDGAVSDTKTLTVTYLNPITILEKVSIAGNPTLNTGCALYDDTYSVEMKYKVTAAPGHVGMLWGTLDEHSAAYVEDMANIIVDFLADNDRAPTMVGSVINYSAPTTIKTIQTEEYFINQLLRNGEPMPVRATFDSAPGFGISGELYILHPTSSYMLEGIDVYHFKIKKNGVVVHDFRAAENNGVYGFCDIITNKFISNTGSFGTITA